LPRTDNKIVLSTCTRPSLNRLYTYSLFASHSSLLCCRNAVQLPGGIEIFHAPRRADPFDHPALVNEVHAPAIHPRVLRRVRPLVAKVGGEVGYQHVGIIIKLSINDVLGVGSIKISRLLSSPSVPCATEPNMNWGGQL